MDSGERMNGPCTVGHESQCPCSVRQPAVDVGMLHLCVSAELWGLVCVCNEELLSSGR